jgi:hypothetical protein
MTMILRLLSTLGLVLMLGGCQSAYYDAMEKVGVHKRDILVDRVEEAQKSQIEGQQQFQSALAQFKAVVAVDGGELEKRYRKLDAEYQASVKAAEAIRGRIDAVDTVAEALFKEWRSELKQYTNPALKAESERNLKVTQQRYRQLYAAMENAERTIEPVLNTLRDHVLYLKHNLNARAITAIRGEADIIDTNVQHLVNEMQRSISEADSFLAQLRNANP